MTDVRVVGVSKRFGEKQVLSDYSRAFPAGGITCLMGPSGCGKTTLLSIIMGIIPPDVGTITGVPERVGAVFQEDRLIERLSAVQNIRLVTGKRLARGEIEAELKLLALSGSENVPSGTLSGGMKRRVALARAVMYDPELLILDEPMKGLDADTRLLVVRYLARRAEGKTVIMVTHDPEEARLLGANIVTMKAP